MIEVWLMSCHMLWLTIWLSDKIDHDQVHPLLWIKSIVFILLPDVISSSPLTWYNKFQSFDSTELSLILFYYLDSSVLPFIFHVEDGERLSQLHYG